MPIKPMSDFDICRELRRLEDVLFDRRDYRGVDAARAARKRIDGLQAPPTLVGPIDGDDDLPPAA